MFDVPSRRDREDARRCVRERTELISERVGLTNRIGAVLATLGVSDYNPLLRSRHRRLTELRTGLGEPLPRNAQAKIERLLARLELVLAQIAELERERDAVVEAEASDKASKILRGIGVQSATVLVREAFVRRFANGKALGSYAGLASSPYSSGGIDREQGIESAGNRRVRTVMVELAWLWTRLSAWRAAQGPLVSRAGWINRTACSEDYGGGPGPKTTDCAVAVRHRRCGARRCNPKACCLIGSAVRSALRTRSSPPIQGNVAVVRHGATAPFTQSGAVLELSCPEWTVVGINSRRM